MATFASYPHQTMASNNDFTLFPNYDWSQDQSFIPPTTYQDQSYMQSTTFDSAYSNPAFTQPIPDQFQFEAAHHYNAPIKTQAPLSPRQSPANSASNSFDCNQPNFLSSVSDSGASAASTISSAMASPSVLPQQNEWPQQQGHVNYFPGIVQHDEAFATTGLDFDPIPVVDTKGCVDPSLIQPFSPQFNGASFDAQAIQSPQVHGYAAIPSPAPSGKSMRSPRVGNAPQIWQPYPTYDSAALSRRQSISSIHSRHSQGSISSDDSNKGLCPIPSCGRTFKDLKAHMLTHQETRPEKCPIPTCEYHTKGFARKYDKNRHTLTHYKGTMVCGFCPGSGSAAEKSFNRADVFKRHLTSVHGVEQTPPNARRRSPTGNAKRPAYGVRDASGMCSTCGNAFASPQDFYEHLDDCVLRVVQQADPSEAVNEKLLSSMTDDPKVQETMERHMLPTAVDFSGPTSFADDDEAEEEEDDDDEDSNYGAKSKKSTKARKAGTNAS